MNGFFGAKAVMGVLALFAATASPTAQDLRWQKDYGQALRAAKRQRMPLLVVLERPDDKQQQFQQISRRIDTSEKDLLQSYQLCRVDVTSAYGRKVAAAFGVARFPHTAIIDRFGERVIFRKTGQLSSAEWLTALVTYRTGRAPRPVFFDVQPQSSAAACFT